MSEQHYRSLAIGVLTGSIVTLAATGAVYFATKSKHDSTMDIVDGVDGLIGNTKLMRIRSLSEATGCTILVSGGGRTT